MLGEEVGCVTYLVQHHVADGRKPLGLLCAGGHELEAQQEGPFILTLRTRFRQVCAERQRADQTRSELRDNPSKNFVTSK